MTKGYKRERKEVITKGGLERENRERTRLVEGKITTEGNEKEKN